MAKIKIEDLPEDMEFTWEEMKKLRGGTLFASIPRMSYKLRFIDPGDDKFAEPLDYSR